MTARMGPVTIFDLDYTLTRYDSFARFTTALILRSWWRILLAVVTGPATLALWFLFRQQAAAGSMLLWAGTVGETMSLSALVELHCAEVDRHGDGFCQQAVLHAATLMNDSERVVVVTASGEVLAREIVRRLGLEVDVVGSSLERCGWGWWCDRHCHGARKVEMLIERGYPPPWRRVYTDSASDIPLLRGAEDRFLLNPTPKSLQKVVDSLGTDNLTVLRW